MTCVMRCIMSVHHLMSPTGIPVYLRLRELIVAAIIDGTYGEGALLPSVRAFAAEHHANPLTVAKAYQQLQNDALVQVQRGVGMFVATGAAERLRRLESDRFLAQEWPAIRRKLRLLGLSPGELLAGS
jgi:GntR family transcriptional regulator